MSHGYRDDHNYFVYLPVLLHHVSFGHITISFEWEKSFFCLQIQIKTFFFTFPLLLLLEIPRSFFQYFYFYIHATDGYKWTNCKMFSAIKMTSQISIQKANKAVHLFLLFHATILRHWASYIALKVLIILIHSIVSENSNSICSHFTTPQ